ncbi:hypothetical protein GH862_31250 [Bacillus thuringiensis]|nr:hypothetical protein [Bacillus thuringiensis]
MQQKLLQSGEFTETTLILLIAIRANPGKQSKSERMITLLPWNPWNVALVGG